MPKKSSKKFLKNAKNGAKKSAQKSFTTFKSTKIGTKNVFFLKKVPKKHY